MNVKIEESWRKRRQEEFDKPYFEKLVAFVKSEYGHANVLPPGHQIFSVSLRSSRNCEKNSLAKTRSTV